MLTREKVYPFLKEQCSKLKPKNAKGDLGFTAEYISGQQNIITGWFCEKLREEHLIKANDY